MNSRERSWFWKFIVCEIERSPEITGTNIVMLPIGKRGIALGDTRSELRSSTISDHTSRKFCTLSTFDRVLSIVVNTMCRRQFLMFFVEDSRNCAKEIYCTIWNVHPCVRRNHSRMLLQEVLCFLHGLIHYTCNFNFM